VREYPCGKTDWSDTDVRYSKMCYSDVPYLYTGRGFAEHQWPYGDSEGRYPAMEYPVLISYFAWGASELTALMPSGPSQTVRAATDVDALWGLPGMSKEVNTYFLLTAVLLLLCGLGSVFFLAGASPARPWDAMGFALSPALLATALVNWDLFAVLFVGGALWAWSRDRPVLAGVMVGLGVATKLYPLFLLGAFLIDTMRRREGRRYDVFALTAVSAGGAWFAVNAPAIMSGIDSWKVFWSFNSDRGADLGSLWLVLTQLGVNADAHLINVVSGILFGLACLAVLVLGMTAQRRAQVAQLAFLLVAAFLIVNKVYSPQYVLWLLPLAILARPNWRDLLIWQAGELLYFGAVWLYLGGWLAPGSGTNPTAYQLAIIIRVAAEVYLMGRVVADILAPTDPFGRDSEEEPSDDGSSDDGDLVEGRGGEADPDLDLVADRGRVEAGG